MSIIGHNWYISPFFIEKSEYMLDIEIFPVLVQNPLHLSEHLSGLFQVIVPGHVKLDYKSSLVALPALGQSSNKGGLDAP